MYALSVIAEGDCYLCVPPDPRIEPAALGASESALPITAPAKALHTFTLDSGASRCFFHDSTTLTPLPAPVPVRLADPSGGLVLARTSTVLPCPAVPTSSLSGLHLPSFSTKLVSTVALRDAMVTTTTPGGQHVSICTCTRKGRHLATFTHPPGLSLYTLTAEPPQVAASAQVSASGPVPAPCLCRLLSHQTLLWHHCLGHPSLPRLRGMHSPLLVSSLPSSLPPLPPSPAPPCLPCVEGQQRAAPHSSFPPTTAPLQTLHMDVWGLARVSEEGRECYILLVVDNYTRYTTVFPLHTKGEVLHVLIPWIRAVRLQLRERFREDLLVMRLHSDRGAEFSSDLLREFCRGEGILQSFTLPASPQQNGIAERRIGLVMVVARTSMNHAGAPHFLLLFAVRYAAHQLNPWPHVSLPETSPTLRWTGKVGDASVFRGPAPLGVSQVDPLPGTVPVEVAVDSRAARGVACGGVLSGGAVSGGAEPAHAEPRGAELARAEPGGAGSEGADSGGAEPGGAEPGGTEPEGAEPGGVESEGAESSGAEPRGTASAGGPAGPRTRGTGAAGAGGVGGAGAGDPGAGDPGARGTGAGGARAGGTGGGDFAAGGTSIGGARAGGAGSVVSLRLILPHLFALFTLVVVFLVRVLLLSLALTLWHFVLPLFHCKFPCQLLLHPPESDLARATSPTVPRLLATVVTHPSFESTAASALVAELVDFAAASRLDYATSLVVDSESECPPSVGGECALGTDVLEDRHEDFECLAAAVPHLGVDFFQATFTRWPGSSLYKLATEPSQVDASAQVSASGQVAASCSCRLLLHQTLLWHHRLGHPSLPRLCGMHFRLLVSVLSRSLPPLTPSPAPPYLPCVEGRQRAAPHSSSFPPTTAPLHTLHMDVWGPARVNGQSRERYFLLVVDDCTRYTTVFPLRSKGQVVDVLIPWIRTVRLQLRERFGQDLPVLRLHSDRGGDFFSNLLWDFCRGEGNLQSFTLPDSPQQNGIAERRIGLVMEVARTSMIHAAAPHFLWLFAVQYAAHHLNLWPRVSLPETSPTLRWTGEVGDASMFRFYHPTSHRVFHSQDVTFDESVPSYCLFPFCSAPPPLLPLFLAPGPPPVDPLPPQGSAPSGVSEVDPLPSLAPLQVAVDSDAARGTASGGAASGGAEPGGAVFEGAETGGVETRGAEPGGVATGVGAEPQGASSSGGFAGASLSLSPQQMREWFVRRTRLRRGASRAGGAGPIGAGCLGVAAGAGVTGGAATAGPGGARTQGTGAAGSGGVEGTGAGEITKSGTTGAGGAGAGGAGVGGPSAGGAGVGGPGVGGDGAGGARAVDPGGAPPLKPASPLPAPSPYTEQSGGLTERCEPASRHVSPVRPASRVPCSRPPLVPGTHAMTLHPSSVPLRVPLPAPPESSLPEVPDPKYDRARAASLTVSHLLATADTDPSFESVGASALVAELLDFAAACRLDYATALVVESASASPPSVGGECALGTDVLKDRQEDFESLAAAVPCFASMLLAPEGDPNAPNIPITGPYSSRWQAAMDAEMASCKSTGTYVDEVPPHGANIVDGMWIFRVNRQPGSPPAFKARYVARGFSQRPEVDYFHTFSPNPKMTTLRMLLHVAAQRDYELHSLDFITPFVQSSLHEEIWLRRPPGFTESFPAGTRWSLERPVYGLRQVPREWHDTLRTTLAALGFSLATADPSLFLRTDTSLPPFYILVYVDDLVFATADTEALTLVKSELQKRHTCTDLGELRSYLGLQITRDRARCTITLTQSHMVHQVLRLRFSRAHALPHAQNFLQDTHAQATCVHAATGPRTRGQSTQQLHAVVVHAAAHASFVLSCQQQQQRKRPQPPAASALLVPTAASSSSTACACSHQ
ncbi:unnamed protein product [Closterium sp. NIES-54]